MENEETQTKTQTEQSTGTVENTVGATPPEVEGEGRKPEVSEGNVRRSTENQVGYLSRKLEKMEKLMSDYFSMQSQNSNPAGNVQPSSVPVSNDNGFWQDFFANPNDYIQKTTEGLMQRKLEEEKLKRQLEENTALANEYVYSQKDIPQEAYTEIVDVAKEEGLYPLLNTNPLRFAQNAVDAWRERNGTVSPEIVNKTSAKMRAGGVSSGPSPANASSGKRIYSRAEIDAIALNPKEWEKKKEDIRAAHSEGRISD